MAGTDTVIVDIPALEEAIASFKQCSNEIKNCGGSLEQNAGMIMQAWKSMAADTYQTKTKKLSQNVEMARNTLDKKIQELTELCEKSKAAEKTAQGIADSIDSNFMTY